MRGVEKNLTKYAVLRLDQVSRADTGRAVSLAPEAICCWHQLRQLKLDARITSKHILEERSNRDRIY